MTVAQSMLPVARAVLLCWASSPTATWTSAPGCAWVGISKSTDDQTDWVPSSVFFAEYGGRLAGIVNLFVVLQHGEARFGAFQDSVDRAVGHPVNVVRGSELLGLPKIESITGVERDGLLLFAVAVILGGVVLAGQALVRAGHRRCRRPRDVAGDGAPIVAWPPACWCCPPH